MTQQVAIVVGIPFLTAIAATQSDQLTGIQLALGVDIAVTLVSVVLVWFGLRRRGDHGTEPSAVPVPREAELAAAAD
jgi:hypothetical protein